MGAIYPTHEDFKEAVCMLFFARCRGDCGWEAYVAKLMNEL